MMFLACFLAVAGVVGFVGYSYANIKVPQPGDFALAQTTKVYYAPTDSSKERGSLMGSFAELNREIIPGDQIPQSIKDAIVASEDRTFYQNQGIDPQGMLRAAWKMVTGGSRQGGSTITQQYIERYYMGTTEDLKGKFDEMLLAVKVTNMGQTSKDEILNTYLNTIYFGRGAYGVQTAAQAYFGKPAKELTTAESAMLVGIVPAPSAYDPAVNKDAAISRWNYVLGAMVEMGTLSQSERDSMTFPDTAKAKSGNALGGPKGYLLDMVRRELLSVGYTQSDIETGGYTIVTTIDKQAQKDAVTAMGQLPSDAPKYLGYSIVSIDPSDGGLKALWGGKDYVTKQLNAATQEVAQAGSTFKPFTLAAALEDGKTLWNGYPGYSPMKLGNWTLKNDGNVSYGWLSLLRATMNSVNTVYAQLNEDIGPAKTRDAAIRAGIPKDTASLNDYPTNVLGVAAVHPIDMATAYATLAAQGVYHKTHIVASVSAGSGHEAYRADTKGRRVFDESVMADVTYALAQTVQGGTGTKARALGRPVAGKTGTTDDTKSAWFCGYTPQLATVVGIWGQKKDGTPTEIKPFGGYASIYGGSVPLDMWLAYMQPVMATYEIEQFPERSSNQRFYTPRSYATPSQQAEPSNTPSPRDEPTKTSKPEPTKTTKPEPTKTTRPEPGTTRQPTRPTQTQQPVQPTQDSSNVTNSSPPATEQSG